MGLKGYRNPGKACSRVRPDGTSGNCLSGARNLAHQREQIILAISEKGHPKVVLGHLRNHVWLVFKLCSGLLQPLVGGPNIPHLEIKDRARMIEFRLFRLVQHQAHAAAIEKGELPSTEQMLQSQNVAVERRGAIHIVRVDGNLPDAGERCTVLHIHGKQSSGKAKIAESCELLKCGSTASDAAGERTMRASLRSSTA